MLENVADISVMLDRTIRSQEEAWDHLFDRTTLWNHYAESQEP